MKRTMQLTLAIAVLALSAPSFAGAAGITSSEGNLLAPGTWVNGVSHDTVLSGEFFVAECESLTLAGEISQNNGSRVTVVDTGLSEASGCSSEGTPLPIMNVTFIDAESANESTGTLGFTLEVDFPFGLTCHYGASAIPFSYQQNSDEISYEGTLTPSSEICGNLEIAGDATLTEAKTGLPVVLD
ncbi:MAG TPA: hypothetical protein VEB65_06075 [Solirubrobacterales bacterium]|nr:hypothetical protein [Solirubrobacterales bacterium]